MELLKLQSVSVWWHSIYIYIGYHIWLWRISSAVNVPHTSNSAGQWGGGAPHSMSSVRCEYWHWRQVEMRWSAWLTQRTNKLDTFQAQTQRSQEHWYRKKINFEIGLTIFHSCHKLLDTFSQLEGPPICGSFLALLRYTMYKLVKEIGEIYHICIILTAF